MEMIADIICKGIVIVFLVLSPFWLLYSIITLFRCRKEERRDER